MFQCIMIAGSLFMATSEPSGRWSYDTSKAINIDSGIASVSDTGTTLFISPMVEASGFLTVDKQSLVDAGVPTDAVAIVEWCEEFRK